MEIPTGPFWIWTDIDGGGDKWRLAYISGGDTIHYPMDDFDDNFYPDEWDEDIVRLIETPEPLDL